MTKTCTICHKEKSLDAFALHKEGARGRNSQCRTCRSEYNANLRKQYATSHGTQQETEKLCPGCDQKLPLDAYYRSKTSRLGVQTLCIPCIKAYRADRYAANLEENRRKAREYGRANRAAGSLRIRKWNLLRKYGLTQERYDEMLAAQGGGCAICGSTTPGAVRNGATPPASDVAIFRVDHCHQTGKVRGLLCNACNTGIGMLGDDPNRVMDAATYLFAHQDVLNWVAAT